MKQVFSNLLSNARKFCPNGKIEIRIQKTPEHTAVSIQDHGAGIPRQNIGKVFEPFFKTDAPDRTPGSGLGLAIAKKWIEFHHGNIWVESDGEGKGTTVTFTLPK
jgi:two-component system sensor histidine kinase VicK